MYFQLISSAYYEELQVGGSIHFWIECLKGESNHSGRIELLFETQA